MKIQLDSSALERLIGGDTEIEIELRQAIVNTFVKKQLKAVINGYAWGKAVEAAQAHVNEAVREHFGVEGALTRSWVEASERMCAAVRAQVDEYSTQYVERTLTKLCADQRERWTRNAYQQLFAIVQDTVKAQVSNIVQAALDAHLAAMPGQIEAEIESMVADAVQERLRRAAAFGARQ